MRVRAPRFFSSSPLRSVFASLGAAALVALLSAVPAHALVRNGANTDTPTPRPALAPTATVKPNFAALTGQKYELRLHHLHTGESIDVVYRVGNTYIPSALAKLNYFLRDWRTDQETNYDPKEFDVLHALLAKLGKQNDVIDVVCGYRTPTTNNFLRTKGGTVAPSATGVALHSQHELAKAIDIRVPGVSTLALRNAALSLHDGGVGYYPVSGFVHVDVGPVRQWSFGEVQHHRG